jgi:hypothetical protein
MIEQAVQATLGAYGSWSHLSVLVVGDSFEREGEFLLSKGVREENIGSVPLEGLKDALKDRQIDLLLLKIPREIPYTGAYSEVIETLHQLRDNVSKPRIMVIESELLGYEGRPQYGEPLKTMKQVYLEILEQLQAQLGAGYVNFHEELIREVREEDYEKRLCYIFDHETIKKLLTTDVELKNKFLSAQLRSIVSNHSSRSFEAGFIAGNLKEKQALLKVLRPKSDWNEFLAQFPKDSKDLLRCRKISDQQIDPDKTEIDCQIWDELEKFSGSFFDYHGKKTFNRLSSSEKYQLTGDTQFDKEDEEEKPDISNNFRKFQVQGSGLNSLLGGANFGGSLGGNNNLLAGLNKPFTPPALAQQKLISLEEHGEVFLSMLAAWNRNAVVVGGALYEYNYVDEEGLVLGSVIALAKDEKLLKLVQDLEKALDLPKLGAIDAKGVLKAFFSYNKNYIKFYDKVRSQLKSTFDQHLGSITKEDYDKERERESSLESGVKVDMKARKEREKRLAEISLSSMKARQDLLKKLKDRPKDGDEDSTEEERAVEVATIELSLTEDEIEKISKSLEAKRLELESKIEIESKRREELQDAIRREQEVRDEKRKELELQRLRKIEAEKADFARRQQRLVEERKKREEVKKMRAKSLREAFDRAREAAMRKQEIKTSKDDDKRKDNKKVEKKKYNPEAVKMMIRFGTDDRKIISTTGISEEDLIELRDTVTDEDSAL